LFSFTPAHGSILKGVGRCSSKPPGRLDPFSASGLRRSSSMFVAWPTISVRLDITWGIDMIVVEFRRPTFDANIFDVAATLRVEDGRPVAEGEIEVIPMHALVGTPQGLVSFDTDPEGWAAHIGYAPWCPFLIPVIVAGPGALERDPHQHQRGAGVTSMAELAAALPALSRSRSRVPSRMVHHRRGR
jgi:hypothetical protein